MNALAWTMCLLCLDSALKTTWVHGTSQRPTANGHSERCVPDWLWDCSHGIRDLICSTSSQKQLSWPPHQKRIIFDLTLDRKDKRGMTSSIYSKLHLDPDCTSQKGTQDTTSTLGAEPHGRLRSKNSAESTWYEKHVASLQATPSPQHIRTNCEQIQTVKTTKIIKIH